MRPATCAVALWLVAHAASLPAGEPFEIPLWPDGVPGPASAREEVIQDRPVTDGTGVERDRHIRGVTTPTLTVYLPDDAPADRSAVVILPGGGFNILAIDKEGHDVARWLNEHGIAGIVVKYRLPDPEAGLFVTNGSLPDVRRAIRLTRAHATEWGIRADRIGVAGFSAGGYLTAAAGTMFDRGDPDAGDPVERASCRPDFIAPIYPLVSLGASIDDRRDLVARMLGPEASDDLRKEYSPEQRVSADTPPTFLVHTTDDGLSAEHSVAFYLALKQANVPVEMHVYAAGGHGYGIRQRGLPVSSWGERWLEWLRAERFIEIDAPRAFVPLLSDAEAWERLPLEGPDVGQPLPLWARATAHALPETTAAMLVLDRRHRTDEQLDPVLRGKIRWVAADAIRCAYSRSCAESDLRRAGLDDGALAAFRNDPEGADPRDRAVLAFARKMALAASTVTDEEVAELVEAYGEKPFVAVVLLLAHAGFQDHLFLALGIPDNRGGALPPLDVSFQRRDDPVEVPDRDPPEHAAPESPATVQDAEWLEVDFDALQKKLESQQNRESRIRVPSPEEAGRAGLRIQWSLITGGYQRDLTQQWFACQRSFHRESGLDPVLAQSLFWVVTRTIHCFY